MLPPTGKFSAISYSMIYDHTLPFGRPEAVAEGILELITDTNVVGRVMTVTKEKGRRYIRLLGDSKL